MPERWSVHTLVFDLDDTLYPERDYVLSGFAAVGAWMQQRHGVGDFVASAAELFQQGRRGAIFDELLAKLAPKAACTVAEMVEIYRAHMPVLEMPTESVTALEWARGKFRIGVVTDGYLGVQQRKAEALNLRRWTEHVVFSDQWGREAWKPSRRPFEEIMRRLPGEPSGYVYIADNPRKDFIGPRALGWRTVRYRRAGGEHATYEPLAHEAAECEIGDLRSLTEFIGGAVCRE